MLGLYIHPYAHFIHLSRLLPEKTLGREGGRESEFKRKNEVF